MKIRGGAIIPTGKIIQNTTENSLDPLTLLVCLDEQGKAAGKCTGMREMAGLQKRRL